MYRTCLFILGLVIATVATQPSRANAGESAASTVAIVGTGDMGDSLGPRFAELGYRVVYGSRRPDSVDTVALVERTGHGATAASQADAAQAGDIVVLAVPWPAMEKVARSLGDLTGKIVIDLSMPFTQGKDGYPEMLVDSSSGQLIQNWNPGARVVKAFATLGSEIIDEPRKLGGPVTVPLASDDREAKETVGRIVAKMGFDPVDFGPIRMAREMEIMQLIYMIPLLQNRPQSWEFYFRRSTYWYCLAQANDPNGEWYEAVYDAGDLADLPQTEGAAAACSD
jgi:predicted dinucleotide-binding enzyme